MNKMILCRFFTYGFCRNGDSCKFIHEKDTSTQNHFQPSAPAPPAIKRFDMSLDTKSQDPNLSRNDESTLATSLDSRASVPCKFLHRPGGCQRDSCPFLHTRGRHEVKESSSQCFESTEDEDEEREDNYTRGLSGATVYFNEFGHILRVSLPTDYSLACVTGLTPGTTPEAVVNILHGLGFDLDVDCVRIPRQHTGALETKAMVKVENPLFAQELSTRLKRQKSTISAVPVAMHASRSNCRKVYISWHKATRSVWLNFGNGEIANRVAQKFNEGRYQCLGQSIKSSIGRRSTRGGGLSNRVAWTITLSDVPKNAISQDVERAITAPYDKPRHVEMGSISYRASDPEVSVEVRSRLEDHGPLESFYLAPLCKGKRVKATAWFQDEADARSASSLNDVPLDSLEKGKLTVTLIQSTKVKVSTTVYFASKSRIDKESKLWKDQRLTFHVYSDSSQRFITLKVEGNNAKDVANARKSLDKILSGAVLVDGDYALWSSALNSNGSAYKKLKGIEKELHIVVIRDKSKRQLRFHGPSEKFQQAVRQIVVMLKEEYSTGYGIDLNTQQFSRMIHGGFKSIEQELGKNVAVFDVVCRKLIIHGTQQQHETALEMMDGKRAVKSRSLSDGQSLPEGDCPICFCEAESPIHTSCTHTYCLECFEEYCKSAASTIKDQFQVRCQGDEGTCSTIFTLRELKDHLSSSVFETVLKSSFEEYIRRHPETFHCCPTPDCGYVYRCTTAELLAYICPNCIEPLCTSCHARHGDYTCAEYKDITSGGYAALEKLKKVLNIKDCPKCSTPIEKTEGCNHMTCGGCRAHICWACMEVFRTSDSCYDHMNKEHGGIGIGLDRFMD